MQGNFKQVVSPQVASPQVVSPMERKQGAGSDTPRVKHSRSGIGQSPSLPLFRTIPPERIGLQGEYDHQGLAKRVILAFRQNLSANEINDLRVTQRGAVVVLRGSILSQRLLIKLVTLAMTTTGTADVEVNGISIGYSLKSYLEVKPSPEILSKLQSLVSL
jgi:hypothetical protein